MLNKRGGGISLKQLKNSSFHKKSDLERIDLVWNANFFFVFCFFTCLKELRSLPEFETHSFFCIYTILLDGKKKYWSLNLTPYWPWPPYRFPYVAAKRIYNKHHFFLNLYFWWKNSYQKYTYSIRTNKNTKITLPIG